MPHPAWDETIPQGTALANTIDTIIQQVKAEVRERMNDIVVDWTADPVELKPTAAVGLRTGLQFTVSGLSAVAQTGSNPTYGEGFCLVYNGGVSFIGLPLQKGWQVLSIEVLTNNNTVPDLTIQLRRADFSETPTSSLWATAHNTTGLSQISQMLSSPIDIDEIKYWYVKFSSSAALAYTVYGVRITYDEVEI